MKINEDRIIDDAQKIFTLTDSPSYSKDSIYTGDLDLINLVYGLTHGKCFILPNIDNPYYDKLYLKRHNKNFDEYANLVIEYQDYYLKLADIGERILNDNGMFFTHRDCKYKYTDKEAKELLLDFFNDEGINKYVKSLFDEERIGFADLEEDTCEGFCINFISNLKSYIVLSSRNEKLDLQKLEYLAHELGHAVENKHLLNKHNNEFFDYKNLVFSEIASTFYEYEFLRYLQKNRIGLRDANNLVNTKNITTLSFLNEIKSFTVDSVEIDGDTYLALNDEYYVIDNKNIERIFKKENSNDMAYVEFKFYDPLIYGLGGYIALHLSEIKKQDPKEFKKMWNNFLSMRTLMSYEDALRLFNINKEDFLSGRVIEPIVKNDFNTYTKQLKKQL